MSEGVLRLGRRPGPMDDFLVHQHLQRVLQRRRTAIDTRQDLLLEDTADDSSRPHYLLRTCVQPVQSGAYDRLDSVRQLQLAQGFIGYDLPVAHRNGVNLEQ